MRLRRFTANIDFPVTNITQIFFSALSSYVGNKVLGADGYPSGEDQVRYTFSLCRGWVLALLIQQSQGIIAYLKNPCHCSKAQHWYVYKL